MFNLHRERNPMCLNQDDVWVCDDCDHTDHSPKDCTECDCYNCDPKHDEGWTGYCCHCSEMAAKYGSDDPCEDEEE